MDHVPQIGRDAVQTLAGVTMDELNLLPKEKDERYYVFKRKDGALMTINSDASALMRHTSDDQHDVTFKCLHLGLITDKNPKARVVTIVFICLPSNQSNRTFFNLTMTYHPNTKNFAYKLEQDEAVAAAS